MTKLWLLVGLLGAQTTLPLSRLVWYSDGRVYWVREAILPFTHREMIVKVVGPSKPLTLLPQPEYRVKQWQVQPDTCLLSPKGLPQTLKDFLRRHIGTSVWVSYTAGNDWEEVQGVIEAVDTEGDLLLRRPSGERLWLPAKLIQAARAEGQSVQKASSPAWRLSVEVDTLLPAARLAVAGWDSLSPWQAQHLLYLTGPTRLTLLTWVTLPPSFLGGSPVEVFLSQVQGDSTQPTLWHLPLQRVLPDEANHLLLLRAELPYTEVYRASLPDLVENLDPFTLTQWRGWAERTLQILNTEKVPLPSGSAFLFDEQGLPLAQSSLALTPPASAGYLPLTHNQTVQLRLQETEVRREKARDPYSGPRLTLTGTLRVQNSSTREVRLLVEKPITGQPVPERMGFARSTPLPERRGPNPRHLLQWELLLRPGATEVLEYTYEVLLPQSR